MLYDQYAKAMHSIRKKTANMDACALEKMIRSLPAFHQNIWSTAIRIPFTWTANHRSVSKNSWAFAAKDWGRRNT